MSAGRSEFGESNNEARHANPRPYVEELGDNALDQMAKGKSPLSFASEVSRPAVLVSRISGSFVRKSSATNRNTPVITR